MLQLEKMFQIIMWGLGILGTLLLFIGYLIIHIYRLHREDNDSKFHDNREDHKIIYKRIDGHLEDHAKGDIK